MQDWERFGEEIRRTVQDAVDSQDYRKLNQTITDTINRAVNGAVNGAEQGMRSFGNAFDQATRNMGRGPGGPRGRYGQMGGADRWGRTPGGGVPPFGTYRWSGTDENVLIEFTPVPYRHSKVCHCSIFIFPIQTIFPGRMVRIDHVMAGNIMDPFFM